MLEALRKWFVGRPTLVRGEWSDLARWADSRRYTFRRARQNEGFAIEGRTGASAWRLEWGPSQRSYVRGQELRLRADLGLPAELQALVLNRELQEAMERDVFDQYVEDVQTRVDTRTPPEMRWLVMYPAIGGQEMKGLRERWTAVANLKPWAERWLAGPLAADLAARQTGPSTPVVLMVSRGRLTLRAAMDEPDRETTERWLRLFETALREALRVGPEHLDAAGPTTQPSLWATSAMSVESIAAAP